MSEKMRVAGTEINIEASSLQEVTYEEKQDWPWC
jgi:hypothetical protein